MLSVLEGPDVDAAAYLWPLHLQSKPALVGPHKGLQVGLVHLVLDVVAVGGNQVVVVLDLLLGGLR